MSDTSSNLVRAAEIRAAEGSFSHPWNPRSQIHGTRLTDLAGLKRAALNLLRIPPGKESYVPHAHHAEEEWLYILQGRGKALIEGVEHEVGPGDFMGFPAPSVVHHLRNEGTEDLVYLCGGEMIEVDVVDFPAHGKRLMRRGEIHEMVDVEALRRFPG